jgi:hypothetical protein
MGPCHQTHQRHEGVKLQGVPDVTQQTDRTRCLHRQTPSNQLHSAFQISNGISVLLHKKEGWKIMLRPGLLQAQCNDGKKPISTPTHPRTS